MPYNGSGTFSIVNSFTPNTTILSAPVNENFNDIAQQGLSNAVTRDGQGAISVPFVAVAGTVTAPGYTFSSDLNMGFYRIGTDNLGITLAGSKVGDWAASGLSITGTLTASGALASGALTVTGTITPSGQIVAIAGTKTAPSYSFTGDLDTGIYHIGANNLGISAGDTKIIDVSISGAQVTGTFEATGNTTIGGTLSATGALTANSSAGISGRNTARAFAVFTMTGTTVNFTSGNYFNVASITRVSTGVFDIAFSVNLPSANYAVVGIGATQTAVNPAVAFRTTNRSTSGFRLSFAETSGPSLADLEEGEFVVFGF